MLSSKSSNVPWTIPIDDQKSLNFCLSCAGCPGWKIKPIGSEKVCIKGFYEVLWCTNGVSNVMMH